MAEPTNPANNPAVRERARISMSAPVLKLEVPEIPGFHLHWMRGSPDRIQQAQRAGYDFVRDDEVQLNNAVLADAADMSGNTDMGGRVSMIAGAGVTTSDGQPMRLFLMKLPLEYHQEDLKVQEQRSRQLATTLSQGMIGAEDDAAGDSQHRYVDKRRSRLPDFFNPKRARPR